MQNAKRRMQNPASGPYEIIREERISGAGVKLLAFSVQPIRYSLKNAFYSCSNITVQDDKKNEMMQLCISLPCLT
ncbi:hypothetical protein [Niastella populi]|uniref:Uncharacterized protein n=1 Tax=Niastella populi TaxID=550983 RepID=A0A1V9FGK0_9BACT|nr:hypothetical protein [Niastella populi]OQP57407.1 hypothetical protein A4R26_24630 [Niastella populi]